MDLLENILNTPDLIILDALILRSGLFKLHGNGRNYMQLPTAGSFPVEPHRRCCWLHGLLSARKRQLTYSFC